MIEGIGIAEDIDLGIDILILHTLLVGSFSPASAFP